LFEQDQVFKHKTNTHHSFIYLHLDKEREVESVREREELRKRKEEVLKEALGSKALKR
jgi:hypothetical protein